MNSPPPDPLRVLALVERLRDRFGPQELGQIMQTLLALAFHKAGFDVIKNSVGVPDLQAIRPDMPFGFAIEAKTGENTISLSTRDLDGVLSSGRTPVVAAFFLSDPTPRWWLINAKSLKTATYRRHDIQSKTPVDVGFDLTEQFSRVLSSNFAIAMEGPAPLARLLTN